MIDCSNIRGVCYSRGLSIPFDEVRKELGYAKKLNINSTRVWLRMKEWEKDPDGFLDKVVKYIRLASEFGISTRPVFFSGNRLDPAMLERDFDKAGEAYVTAVIDALKKENVIMWDIMNEPTCNLYIRKSNATPYDYNTGERLDKLWAFVKRYCALTKKLDTSHPITVAHTFPRDIEPTAEDVDIISFHDYLSTRKTIEASYILASEMSKKYGKPLVNSELCCLCRSNPYDVALEYCEKYKVGWYVFELMIHDYWADAHGIFYSDGTVRDPSIPAALMGFHRNRGSSAVMPNANKEGHAEIAIRQIKAALNDETELFEHKVNSIEDVLEAAEHAANLLECCELVPMYDPPSARIQHYREMENPDPLEVRKLAFELAEILREKCQLLP